MAFNEKLCALRTARQLQQAELAEYIGVSKQTISNWENNNIHPSVAMVVRIAKYFCVSSDYLLDLDDKVYIEIMGTDSERLAHLRLIAKDLEAIIKKRNQ